MVSEDASLIPYSVREKLIREGSAHLKNLIYHASGSYIISNATFPSYFLKDEDIVIESHARLDIRVFTHIAKALGITRRYVGDEPTSRVTSIYNRVMAEELAEEGVECIIVPRKELDGVPISASNVRKAIKEDRLSDIRELVPQSTYDYFASDEAAEVVNRIRKAEEVVHY